MLTMKNPPISEFALEVIKLTTACEAFLQFMNQFVPKHLREDPEPYADDGGFAESQELMKIHPL